MKYFNNIFSTALILGLAINCSTIDSNKPNINFSNTLIMCEAPNVKAKTNLNNCIKKSDHIFFKVNSDIVKMTNFQVNNKLENNSTVAGYNIGLGHIIFKTDKNKFRTLYYNKEGHAVEVVFFDNGPDYFQEGLARYIDSNGNMGFIDKKLNVAISAKWKWVSPLKDGKAFFCNNCHTTKSISGLHPSKNLEGELLIKQFKLQKVVYFNKK